MNTPKPKRFIAGAVCPKCGAMDKIMADDKQLYCVACHFEEPRPQVTEPAREPSLIPALTLKD